MQKLYGSAHDHMHESDGLIGAGNIQIRSMSHRLDASLGDNLEGAMPHLDTLVISVEPLDLVDAEQFKRRNESPMLSR